jgi:histidine triad (HIT) family protein
MDCIFCNIVEGKIPSNILYQDNEIVAFADANPQAPTHILIIPREHIQSLNTIDDADMPLLIRMIRVAQQIAKDRGIYDKGYRLVINTGKEGGQVIQHLHLHILGGRQLKG